MKVQEVQVRRKSILVVRAHRVRRRLLSGVGACAALLFAFGCLAPVAMAAPPTYRGILVHLNPDQVANFNARHHTHALRLNPNRDLYLVTGNGNRDDQQLLDEVQTDGTAGTSSLNGTVQLIGGSTTTVHLDGGTTASVLNGGTTASVLNGGTTASVLNGWVDYYGTQAPDAYVNQPAVGQIQSGSAAHDLATGKGVVIAEIDNGVDPFNPVLRRVLLRREGYNFYDGNSDWSAYADVCLAGGTTASVLNGGTTASVLNGGTTASVLNGGTTASVLNGGTTASVLNGGTTASVLNCLMGGTTASVLNGGTTASVLNGGTTASVLNGETPILYILNGGTTASVLNGGTTASVLNGGTTASVLNGVPCLNGGTTASVLNGGTTASVLNGGTTASVLNGESTAVYLLDGGTTASVLNGGTTASVLNGGTTASVLNGGTTGSVLNGLEQIIACNPDFGHGTAVAGLLHLVAPEAKILPIKAFGANGEADAATIYQSITYAIDHHANVINLSFSATDTTDDIREAINEATHDGIVVVAAAGNSASSAAVFPASLTGVIGVGAVDGTAANTDFPIASFSDFDPGVGQFVDVDVAAPGVNLFTTYPGFGLLWARGTGTSFSTPLVAGEAALLAQLGQSGGACQQDIDAASNPAIAGDANGQLGYGLINVLGALTPVHPLSPDFNIHSGRWR